MWSEGRTPFRSVPCARGLRPRLELRPPHTARVPITEALDDVRVVVDRLARLGIDPVVGADLRLECTISSNWDQPIS